MLKERGNYKPKSPEPKPLGSQIADRRNLHHIPGYGPACFCKDILPRWAKGARPSTHTIGPYYQPCGPLTTGSFNEQDAKDRLIR